MKKNLQTHPMIFRMILLITCFAVAMLYNQSKAADILPVRNAKVAVSFQHNIKKRELKITVISNTEAVMQLFLFSPEGELVSQVSVSSQNIATIPGLKKGLYFFECFDNDTRMKSGRLFLK